MSPSPQKNNADLLVDRQHLKNKMIFWRYAFFFLILGSLVFFMIRQSIGRTDYIVRFPINGIIVDDVKQQETILSFARDPHIKAIILSINSPGGTTTGAEALYETVREVAKKKPIVALLGTLATSGGYVLALSSDHIIARGNTLTGSIGVILQWQNFSEALKKLGVHTYTVTSSPIKGQPNFFENAKKDALDSLKDALDTSYEWFLSLVQERRHLSKEKAKILSDGRIYTGWQAKENGLIDEIGGEDKARSWLKKEHKIADTIPIREWHGRELRLSLGVGLQTKLNQLFDYSASRMHLNTL